MESGTLNKMATVYPQQRQFPSARITTTSTTVDKKSQTIIVYPPALHLASWNQRLRQCTSLSLSHGSIVMLAGCEVIVGGPPMVFSLLFTAELDANAYTPARAVRFTFPSFNNRFALHDLTVVYRLPLDGAGSR